MPWTATVISSTGVSVTAGVGVVVAFNDGTTTGVVTFGGVSSADQLDRLIANQLTFLENCSALTAAIAAGSYVPTPPAEPIDPNAGLVELTVEAFLGSPTLTGILSQPSVTNIRNTMSGALDALRRDITRQDRASVSHWVALVAASSDANPALITEAEAVACFAYLAKAAST